MIWVKRFSPILVILLLWFAYTIYTQRHDDARDAKDHRIAALSGQIWMASARYRENPVQYQKFRDSLLHANGLDDASVKQYVASIEKDADRQYQYAIAVSKCVDSLSRIEDSVRKAALPAKPDSLVAAKPSPAVAMDSLKKIAAQNKLKATLKADSSRPR